MAELHIKNMVCDRCIMTVRSILEETGHEVRSVELGHAEVGDPTGEEELEELDARLREKGFELIREGRNKLVERIRVELIAYLQQVEEREDPPALSEFLSSRMRYNYSYLSHLFSESAGTTIEQHLIRLRIERVKELLTYRELTLSEIAWKLNYSSVQYLSNQFKKVTGMTVSRFRESESGGGERRNALDTLGRDG